MTPHRVRAIVAENAGPLTLDGSRTYVVGASRTLVVDPGPALADHLDAVEVAVGAGEIAAICLTHGHPDHAAGAGELMLRLGAPLAATASTAEIAGLDPPEIPLSEGTTVEFDGGALRTIETPGHSPDHVCFYWPKTGALFTGDVILGEGTSMIAPPEGDMAAYLRTLERLAALHPTVIYPGHGPMLRQPDRVIRAYIDHRLEREAQILKALGDGAASPTEIRSRVYPDLDPALHGAAEGSVRAHLEKLIADGRVNEQHGVYEVLD